MCRANPVHLGVSLEKSWDHLVVRLGSGWGQHIMHCVSREVLTEGSLR